MTLYDLTKATTVQGDVCIVVFHANGNEKERRYARDQSCLDTAAEDFDDIEDLEVTYIYSTKSAIGEDWLHIEVAEDD